MELRVVGAMTLLRDGRPVALPASRKTRALLAFLALSDRPKRRDRLCELLWDVPDDPKGALRWSLSKLRGLLEADGATRIIADRDCVALDPADISVDWRTLQAAASAPLSTLEDAELEALAAIDGPFLDGLDLPRCEVFQGWIIAQREDVRRWQCAILAALTERPLPTDRALAHARRWLERDPFAPAAHLTLRRLLTRAGRDREAEQQRVLSLRLLTEAGVAIPDALRSGGPSISAEGNPDSGLAAAATAGPRDAPATLSEQHVRFCTAADGTGLAWSTTGSGPPLVKTANWLNHLEYDWDSPIWRHWLAALAAGRTLIRYDERGNGLSDWQAPDIGLEAFVDDLTAVVDAAALDRFDLLGVSQGCSVAIAYAVRHPARVRRLILYGGYAAGWRVRDRADEIRRREALLVLTRDGWGQNNPAFRQVFTSLFLPEASPAQMDWFNELQRMTTSPANAVRLMEAFAGIDVRPLLPALRVPTLVLHARDDAVIPFASGREMAAAIPGARFIALDSRNHLLLAEEPAWPRFVSAIDAFLAA